MYRRSYVGTLFVMIYMERRRIKQFGRLVGIDSRFTPVRDYNIKMETSRAKEHQREDGLKGCPTSYDFTTLQSTKKDNTPYSGPKSSVKPTTLARHMRRKGKRAKESLLTSRGNIVDNPLFWQGSDRCSIPSWDRVIIFRKVYFWGRSRFFWNDIKNILRIV